MTREQVIDILKSYRASQRRWETARREIEIIESKLTSYSIDYSKPRVDGGIKQGMEKLLAELADIHKRIDREAQEAGENLIAVKKLILSLDDATEYEVISRRYMSCQHWETISYEMRYSRSRIFQIHDNAITHICEKIKDWTLLDYET